MVESFHNLEDLGGAYDILILICSYLWKHEDGDDSIGLGNLFSPIS